MNCLKAFFTIVPFSHDHFYFFGVFVNASHFTISPFHHFTIF